MKSELKHLKIISLTQEEALEIAAEIMCNADWDESPIMKELYDALKEE